MTAEPTALSAAVRNTPSQHAAGRAGRPANRVPRRRSGSARRRATLRVVEIVSPLAMLALWWGLSAGSTSAFLPPLSAILVKFQELWLFDLFLSDVVPSLTNLAIGFGLAIALGIVGGLVVASSVRLAWAVNPIMNFWRAIPAVAIVPIFVALVGYENESRILSIVVAAVFPTLISTVDAIRGTDPLLDDVGRVYHLTWTQRLFGLRLPAASPGIFAGIQVSLQYAFVVMIASEMMGISVGIGAVTLQAQQTFRTVDMWAGVLLLGVIGYLVNLLFERVQSRVLRWYVNLKKGTN